MARLFGGGLQVALGEVLAFGLFHVAAGGAQAQALARLTFADAVAQATRANPTVAQATTGIMRAEALLQQARAVTRPSINATFTTTKSTPRTPIASMP